MKWGRHSVAEKLPESLASIRIFVTAVAAGVFHRLACPKHFYLSTDLIPITT